jgi:hypothetical protein
MLQFLTQFAFIFGTLLFLAACGFGIPALYTRRFPFVLMASPLAGLLLLTTATELIHSVLYLRIGTALLIASAICLVVTAISLVATGFRPQARQFPFFLLCAILICAVYAAASCASSIATGDQSLLYLDGTDHLGYANIADWMRDHPPSRDMAHRAAEPGQIRLSHIRACRTFCLTATREWGVRIPGDHRNAPRSTIQLRLSPGLRRCPCRLRSWGGGRIHYS